jgi:hypothetical protein
MQEVGLGMAPCPLCAKADIDRVIRTSASGQFRCHRRRAPPSEPAEREVRADRRPLHGDLPAARRGRQAAWHRSPCGLPQRHRLGDERHGHRTGIGTLASQSCACVPGPARRLARRRGLADPISLVDLVSSQPTNAARRWASTSAADLGSAGNWRTVAS